MTFFLMLVLLPFYIIIAWQLFTKRKLVVLYTYFLYYFFLDYFNYIIGVDAGLLGYMTKIYPDILFVFLLVYFIYNLDINNQNKKTLFIFFVFLYCVISICYGVFNGFGLSSAILDMRTSVFPVLMAYMLVHNKLLNIDEFLKILRFCGYLVIFNAVIAIYQYITYKGIPESSWRFDFLQVLNLRNDPNYEERMVVYQIERDGNLRASGLFLSALSFSFLEAFYCVYYALSLLNKKMQFSDLLKNGLCISILLLGIYCSQVRTSLIIVFFSFLFLFFVRKSQRCFLRFKPKLAIFVSIWLCFFTFFSIIILGEDSMDASSYGRINQYITLYDNFRLGGYGLGSYKGLFDSFYIYGFMTFGIPFAVFVFYLVFVYCRAYSSEKKFYDDSIHFKYKLFLLLAFVSFPALLYVMSVQHTSGSIYYILNFYLLFLIGRTNSMIGVYKPQI